MGVAGKAFVGQNVVWGWCVSTLASLVFGAVVLFFLIFFAS